jgi:hypothetical protein
VSSRSRVVAAETAEITGECRRSKSIAVSGYPDSPQLDALARTATETTEALVQNGGAAGIVRSDFTVGDLHYADIANGHALRTEPNRPGRLYVGRVSQPSMVVRTSSGWRVAIESIAAVTAPLPGAEFCAPMRSRRR